MYEQIRSRPSPREIYQAHLVEIGDLTAKDCEQIVADSRRDMREEAEKMGEQARMTALQRQVDAKEDDPDLGRYFDTDTDACMPGVRLGQDAMSPMKGMWQRFGGEQNDEQVDTSVPHEHLVGLLERCLTLPDSFVPHAKIGRLLDQRRAMLQGKRSLDWAMAEAAAFATLLGEDFSVRLSGQDCGRGTFSHRHAVLTDVRTGQEHVPLAHIGARFEAIDSSLSELGVLGFEVGYSYDTPDGLVIWEAQFGDFANGAQIIIDQFIAGGEQKWRRFCGLVLLLPHGYEGQGPEHSSARIERFLSLAAQDSLQVANLTTAGQYFHCLRRQMLRSVRKPLVIMSPKSLLRAADASVPLDALTSGGFQTVIPEHAELGAVRRVVLCSGKIYFELLKAREAAGIDDIALVRVEMLYPFPADAIREALAPWPGAEVMWCQEEPANMGAWPMFLHWFLESGLVEVPPRVVARAAAASPATGSHRTHVKEQRDIVSRALDLEKAK
jgi:2-oxoglutarate dehydrogenase E1 component